MYGLIYDFFFNTVFKVTSVGANNPLRFNVTLGTTDTNFAYVLCSYCAIFCTLLIVTLCALFIWKMIKLVGGLITR